MDETDRIVDRVWKTGPKGSRRSEIEMIRPGAGEARVYSRQKGTREKPDRREAAG